MRSEIYSPPPMSQSDLLYQIYTRLQEEYGPQSWWPADTPFEVMLGAILTQNTSWTNVEKAMENLREVCELTPEGILSLTPEHLEEVIRSSGYFRQKAERLRTLSRFLVEEYQGDLSLTVSSSIQELREQFLALNGIGPETADSILLYALQGPVFVVDAYTVRLFSRLGLCIEKAKYHEVQSLFMDNLEPDVQMFNEFHALIVTHCKQRCQKRTPECKDCVLAEMCEFNIAEMC